MLFSDRTSTAYRRSNQLRLYFSSVAYVLLHMLRRLGLAGTEFAKAQVRHHSAEVAQDRSPDSHHGAQGVGFAGWRLSLRGAVPPDPCQAVGPAAQVLNQQAGQDSRCNVLSPNRAKCAPNSAPGEQKRGLLPRPADSLTRPQRENPSQPSVWPLPTSLAPVVRNGG